jgi:predicted DNA-binding transcriptional regulator YafY
MVATLLLLQSRGRVTAADVAAELEVSERTARRDLDALAAAGVPVYSCPGRGGGWELLGGARLDLTGLNEGEARSLVSAVVPASASSPELVAALRKLVRALPAPFRSGAEAAAAALLVDPAAWGRRPQTRPAPAFLDELQRATLAGTQVRVRYGSARGAGTSTSPEEPASRHLHPLGLVNKSGTWYLVARPAEEVPRPGLPRTYRVDRFVEVVQTDAPVERPADFDLARTWHDIVGEVESLRSPAVLSGLVRPELMDYLGWLFGADLDFGVAHPDGRLPFTLRGQQARYLAVAVAGFGASVEVVEPPEVRDELARIGRELVTAYGSAQTTRSE